MRGACFDKLSMRFFLNATKILPHPERVEGRTASPRAAAAFIALAAVRR
jgi:hypothetical protein